VRRGPAAYLAIGRVDAQRAGESLALMRAAIAELHENQGFDEDFARARRLVLARLVADSGTTAEAATNLAFLARHHLPAEFFHKLVRFVANASVEQVRGLLEAELAADKEIVLVVGDRAQIAATFKGAGIERPKLIRFELADAGRDAAK
jgi:predicted Zn-dependent peptidase